MSRPVVATPVKVGGFRAAFTNLGALSRTGFVSVP
jgi:hypothetical protein